MYMDDFMPGAKACVKLAEIKDGERVLIITDKPPLADVICKAIKEKGIECETPVIYLPHSLRPIKRLTDCFEKIILKADVVFNIIDDIVEESIFRKGIVDLANKNGGRKIFHMVSVREDMFIANGALALSEEDFNQMYEITEKLAMVLTMAEKVKINSAIYSETNMEIELDGFHNSAIVSTGNLLKGSWGNLPSGEAFVLPGNARDGGRILIDGAISYMRPLNHPVLLEVLNNKICVIQAAGKNGLEFEKLLKKIKDGAEKSENPDNLKCLCEFGIGTNPNAGLTEILEIEKIRGTIHIAIGDNSMFGGPIIAPNHIDMVVKRPIVTIDDTHRIIDGGFLNRQLIENYFNIDYKVFDGEISPDYMIKIKDGKSVISHDKSLDKYWKDYRGREYCCQIGDNSTSEKVNVLWENLEKEKVKKIKDIIHHFQKNNIFDKRTICQLINVLKRYDAIDIVSSFSKVI